MANRNKKLAVSAALKVSHRRHAKKQGLLRKAVAQTFTSMLAPLLVGVALQCIQGHHLTAPHNPAIHPVCVSARPSAAPFGAPNVSRDVTQFHVDDDRRSADPGARSF